MLKKMRDSHAFSLLGKHLRDVSEKKCNVRVLRAHWLSTVAEDRQHTAEVDSRRTLSVGWDKKKARWEGIECS